MPSLHRIGKEKVINHHMDVPYRVLKKEYTFGSDEPQNMIIHGDNLEGLKSLLPRYEWQIKCIYIDPPYNTGNEGRVYNDNLTDPKFKKRLWSVVGKEWEDLTRHDKRLCMMYPRLKLLHKLLKDDGVIFISIDDNEQANLKLMMDEIFGRWSFITDAIWRSSDNSNNNALTFSEDCNHTLVYAKQSNRRPNLINDIDKRSHFKNPNNDPRWARFDWNPVNNPWLRPNLQFDIITPNWNIIKHPPNGWRRSRETIDEKLSIWEMRYSEDQTRLIRRTYLNEMWWLTPSNLWIDLDKTGHTRNAKYDLKKIFPELPVTSLFDTPKPAKLIEYILQIATNPWDIILDSFAWSWTTAHAVLNLNKADGGNRKFILLELMDYAETITAERVKRVIQWYGTTPWTGGDFCYYTLGEALFDEGGDLNTLVPLETIRAYIRRTETQTNYQIYTSTSHANYLGNYKQSDYYFHYDPLAVTSLDHNFLSYLQEHKSTYSIIYADVCTLSSKTLASLMIIFKKIPRDISKL
jgi:adenine-specific DNA-methyltransferase